MVRIAAFSTFGALATRTTAATVTTRTAIIAITTIAARATVTAITAVASGLTGFARRTSVFEFGTGFLVDQTHRQANLATRIDFENLDLDVHAFADNIGRLFNALILHFADMDEAVLATHEVHKRTEIDDVDDLSVIDLTDFSFFDDTADPLAGSFDLVVANLVLHHIRPLTGLLGEVLRVLAPGGQFVALEPAPLVGMLVHDQTSDNEAPLWPGAVTCALTRSGFVLAAHEYQWVRLRSSVLGPLSPSYRVSAQRPGPAETARLRLVRELAPSVLPGLSVDTGCRFAALVNEQVAAISECVEQKGLLERR